MLAYYLNFQRQYTNTPTLNHIEYEVIQIQIFLKLFPSPYLFDRFHTPNIPFQFSHSTHFNIKIQNKKEVCQICDQHTKTKFFFNPFILYGEGKKNIKKLKHHPRQHHDS